MAKTRRPPGLDLEVDLRAQQREWVAQRALWALMAVLLVVAGTGFFGTGPMAYAVARGDAGGVGVVLEYPRWTRTGHQEDFTLTVRSAGDTGGLDLRFQGDAMHRFIVESIVPAPSGTALAPGVAVYHWDVEDWSGPLAVDVTVRSHGPGDASGWVEVQATGREGPRLPFETFVWP